MSRKTDATGEAIYLLKKMLKFEKLAKALISVPKSEIDKREAEYQKHKKQTKKRKTA